MKYDPRHMTAQELQFVRLYASALKKNYAEFDSALQLMRTEVGVPCVVRAAVFARQLQRLHTEFDHELSLLADQHGATPRQLPPHPSVDIFIRLLQASFFKLVDARGDKPGVVDDKGWYSGNPIYWADVVKFDGAKDTPSDEVVSFIMNAFIKLVGDTFNSTHHVPGNPLKNVSFDAPPDEERAIDEFEDDDAPEDDSPDYSTDF